jgi:hypothetical protein
MKYNTNKSDAKIYKIEVALAAIPRGIRWETVSNCERVGISFSCNPTILWNCASWETVSNCERVGIKTKIEQSCTGARLGDHLQLREGGHPLITALFSRGFFGVVFTDFQNLSYV